MRFPEGREYVRMTREREQVIRKAPEGTRVRLAISLVSFVVRMLEGRTVDTPGIRRGPERCGEREMRTFAPREVASVPSFAWLTLPPV